jgi:hypothetical protein
VGDAGLSPLKGVTNLAHLELSNTRVTDAGLEHVKGLTNLSMLSLADTQVGDNGLQHLNGLEKLSVLYLYDTKVTDAGMAHLPELDNLDSVHLSGTQVGDTGMKHVARLINLRHLWLDGTRVGDAGMEHLKDLSQLTELALNETQVTDQGLVHLSRLAGLQQLRLFNTRVTDTGLKQLAGLKNLQALQLKRTKVTASGIGELQAALPDCKIAWDGSTEPSLSPSNFALQFDGKGSRVEVPGFGLTSSDPFTLEARVTVDPSASDERMMVLALSHAERAAVLYVDRQSWSTYLWPTDQTATIGAYVKDTLVPRGRTVHVAAVWDGKEMQLFQEGQRMPVSRFRGKTTGWHPLAASRLVLGAHFDGKGVSMPFLGRIHEVRVSSGTRYDRNFSPPARFSRDNDTLALYQLNEGEGVVLKDSSGHGYHGKIVGARWVQAE